MARRKRRKASLPLHQLDSGQEEQHMASAMAATPRRRAFNDLLARFLHKETRCPRLQPRRKARVCETQLLFRLLPLLFFVAFNLILSPARRVRISRGIPRLQRFEFCHEGSVKMYPWAQCSTRSSMQQAFHVVPASFERTLKTQLGHEHRLLPASGCILVMSNTLLDSSVFRFTHHEHPDHHLLGYHGAKWQKKC